MLERTENDVNGCLKRNGTCQPTSDQELTESIVERMNSNVGTLGNGVDCPKCKNRGFIYKTDYPGHVYVEFCECRVIRDNNRRIKASGLGDLVKRYTFDKWEEKEQWQHRVASAARMYVGCRDGWVLAYGRSGSGKTHICTAICSALMEQGLELRYHRWRDIAVTAKALVNNPEEYKKVLQPLKDTKVLYLDDLFKTGKGQEPTVADVNLAFEIIDHRYNDNSKLTIVSTERSLEELMELDEAVAGRLFERSKGYRLDFRGKRNWRVQR